MRGDCGSILSTFQLFFENKTQVKASTKSLTDQSAKKFLPNQSEIFCHFSSKLNKDINEISAWVTWADMELRSYLPRVPFLPAGPTGPLGKKGNLWEGVRNSISAHVTHAEITHFFITLSWLLRYNNLCVSCFNSLI